jgi:hypothetical protein
MDDAMIDLMAGDTELRRRLEAYAGSRLSPDPVVASRMRARVLAVAHRQAAEARGDAALAIVPADGELPGTLPAARRAGRTQWRRAAAVLLAASLGLTLIAGTALAARPGGPLYGTRIWVETLTLPSDPSARAIAELERMDHRLQEAIAARQAGDPGAATAALAAYEAIVDGASARALLDGDAVASAALDAGVARNIVVLQALAGTLPEQASDAIDRAIQRAIDRSDEAVDTIHRGDGGADDGAGGNDGDGNGGGPAAQPTAHPVATPVPTPKATKPPKPTKAPVAEPTSTPRPGRTPPTGGPPSTPPNGTGGGGQGG